MCIYVCMNMYMNMCVTLTNTNINNPPYCTPQAFKGIAKVMGTVINEQVDLRQEVMLSLRKLVAFSLSDESSKHEMARFAKNFLPLFLNLFTSEEIGEKAKIRLAFLETVSGGRDGARMVMVGVVVGVVVVIAIVFETFTFSSSAVMF